MRYPGYMWAQVGDPSDVIAERGNSIAQGVAQQGIDWARVGRNTWLDTFGEIGVKRDTKHYDWNNENRLSVGAKLRYFGLNQSVVSVGARYDFANRVRSDTQKRGPTYFANWYSYWHPPVDARWNIHGFRPLGFPGTAWGQLRFPASHFGQEAHDALLEGAIEQGVDLFHLSPRSALNAFVLVDYTFDSKGLDWDNNIQYGPGVKIRLFVDKGTLLEIGGMERWEYRPNSSRTKHDLVLFLNWSATWNLGELLRHGLPR